MAKKVVATLKTGDAKTFAKVIKMVKSSKTGSYQFKEEIVNSEHVKDFFKKQILLRLTKKAFFKLRRAFFVQYLTRVKIS